MNALHKLQHAFAADLWRDDLHHMQGLILDNKLSAARRFNVYRNNFQSSLVDALAAIYPVVERLVGREFFCFLADQYICTYPSRSGNLHNLGNAMAEFLKQFQATSQLPYLADVARLDWAYHEVFHARAPSLFDTNILEQLAVKDYPELRFKLGPACRLVCSVYPIFRIWKVNQENSGCDQHVNLDDGPESVIVIRPDLDVELWRLDLAEAALLRGLAAGKKLGESVEASLKHSQDFNLRAALDKFFAGGVLVAAKENADG